MHILTTYIYVQRSDCECCDHAIALIRRHPDTDAGMKTKSYLALIRLSEWRDTK